MDPLSIIAAALAIATPVAIGLQKLRHVRQTSAELLMLANEVTDIIVLLQELDQIIRQQNSVSTGQPSLPLIPALNAIHTKLTQLSREIAEWDRRGPAQKSTVKFRVLRRATIVSKVNAFKDDLRRLRCELVTVISAMTLYAIAPLNHQVLKNNSS